jgi:hypothetical protein
MLPRVIAVVVMSLMVSVSVSCAPENGNQQAPTAIRAGAESNFASLAYKPFYTKIPREEWLGYQKQQLELNPGNTRFLNIQTPLSISRDAPLSRYDRGPAKAACFNFGLYHVLNNGRSIGLLDATAEYGESRGTKGAISSLLVKSHNSSWREAYDMDSNYSLFLALDVHRNASWYDRSRHPWITTSTAEVIDLCEMWNMWPEELSEQSVEELLANYS